MSRSSAGRSRNSASSGSRSSIKAVDRLAAFGARLDQGHSAASATPAFARGATRRAHHRAPRKLRWISIKYTPEYCHIKHHCVVHRNAERTPQFDGTLIHCRTRRNCDAFTGMRGTVACCDGGRRAVELNLSIFRGYWGHAENGEAATNQDFARVGLCLHTVSSQRGWPFPKSARLGSSSQRFLTPLAALCGMIRSGTLTVFCVGENCDASET